MKKAKKLLKECERKLNYANRTVHDLMIDNDVYKKTIMEQDVRIEALQKINAMTENHLQICEREHHHKDRLITELKTWISDLIKAED